MPDVERYTPMQMESEIQNLATRYVSAVGEVEEDNSVFSDISTAIQGKTGQVEPYYKDDLATVIINELVKAGLPIDPESLSSFELGVDDGGFYWTPEVGGGTPILLGIDLHGIYVRRGT